MQARVGWWLLVWGGWTLLAAAFAVGSSLTYMITYQPPEWGRTFATSLTEWYPWAVLTAPIAWLARRLRPSGPHGLWRAGALALIGVPAAMIKIALGQILRAAMGLRGYALPGNLVAQYLIYWAIIGLAIGAAYYAAERQRELRASRAEARLAEARLQLLKMQLHPHFLFNTLNMIAELVHEDPAAADRMIGGLSHLLRETLDAGGIDLVPLSRELEMLQRYLEIQRARFGDRLIARIDAPADTMSAPVPVFILQPIVENAIVHGVAARAGEGRVTIRARRQDARLVIEVEDDGPGIRGELREGVGLANTRARLDEMYGGGHGFEIARAPSGGTLVRLAIPERAAAPGASA
jgi:two-component system, LytTR family, sensor kinase